MNKLEKWGAKKIKEIAQKAVSNSVGKSIYPYGHEKKIPEDVKRWLRKKSLQREGEGKDESGVNVSL